MNRETWLLAAASELRKLFPTEYFIPEFHVSIGLPSGGCHNLTMGETFSNDTSNDGLCSVFISPKFDDPIKVLRTLLHEMIHVENNCLDNHNRRFAKIAREVGLAGPPTATYTTPELRVKLQKLSRKLGPYPHSAMSFVNEKTQKTYLKKLQCSCGYLIRTTQIQIDKGLPRCPKGHKLEVV